MTTPRNSHRIRTLSNDLSEQDGHMQPCATPTSRYTFTPSRRMSELCISSSPEHRRKRNRHSKTKYFTYEPSDTAWDEGIDELFGDKHNGQIHPNLSMVLDDDKVRLHRPMSTLKEPGFSPPQSQTSMQSEEESDEEDLGASFSPLKWPENSPERLYNRESIFDEEPGFTGDDLTMIIDEDNNVRDIHLDPTALWTTQIYQDNTQDVTFDLLHDDFNEEQVDDIEPQDNSANQDIENTPPQQLNQGSLSIPRRVVRQRRFWRQPWNTSSQETHSRGPLEELEASDETSQKKAAVFNAIFGPETSKSAPLRKNRFMRSLSPIRDC